MVQGVRVSASFLNTWMRCPLQGKFQYIDKLPTRTGSAAVWGTCLHFALENFTHNHDEEQAVQAFKDAWDDPESIGETIEYWNRYQNSGNLRERGILLLRNYFDRYRREDRRIIATEHPFKVAFGDHELSGRVDLLECRKSSRGKNTLRVIDWKSGKTPWKDALRHNVQMSAYFMASLEPEFWIGYPGDSDYPGLPDGAKLYEEFKDQPRQVIWWSLKDDKEIDAGPRDVADFRRMYRVLDEIERAITYGVFVPCISADSCPQCDYTKECGLDIPSSADRLLQIEPFRSKIV